MPRRDEIDRWCSIIRGRYENYLKTSFYFKDKALRESFAQALSSYDLMKDEAIPEPAHDFHKSERAGELVHEYFPDNADALSPALLDSPLYSHQEKAIRHLYEKKQNLVVATGTASGKTECFLYPILFELYQQHLKGDLQHPGVRALILYPMNALANDQRQRIGDICEKLKETCLDFALTFGQYIGTTPEDKNDSRRKAKQREEERLPGELVFRKEMRENPPHILLTNYSMLEYLLIRPDDSELFDNGRGQHWQFIVLDEAHQYRGSKGMEMGMLLRRLKQRLRDGGRDGPFNCVATSATLSSGEGEEDKRAIAEFTGELFGEKNRFSAADTIFAEREESVKALEPQRFHVFMRALEGAFLMHESDGDGVAFNRKSSTDNTATPLEIALCRECGQHYYVGKDKDGVLKEAIRDPSHDDFGVDFYLPLGKKDDEEEKTHHLCRRCGKLSEGKPDCDCDAAIPVKKCEEDKKHKDQIKECEACGYSRGSHGDPVQEIVHGSDGPNTVIATALHGLLPAERRKILAFADSRQEAAFFAWYAQDSYEKIRDRNLILRALNAKRNVDLSVDDLASRLCGICEKRGVFASSDSLTARRRKTEVMIYRELLSEEKRISLEGVGLAQWFVELPEDLSLPKELLSYPWNLNEVEAENLLMFMLDRLRTRLAVKIPDDPDAPSWGDVSSRPKKSVCLEKPRRQKDTFSWRNQKTIIEHFLPRLHVGDSLSQEEKVSAAKKLMGAIWKAIQREKGGSTLLERAAGDNNFQLNLKWLRVKPQYEEDKIFECDTCARLYYYSVRNICPRNKCPGILKKIDRDELSANHYYNLYQDEKMPVEMRSEEHTAQLQSDTARERQEEFRDGDIHLLSSSTTFEVGVDLGDLDVAFLRNVPPESFNYTQRVGRAGRSDVPGLALTYCRRNPHDLYHYAEPERMMKGSIRPPLLHLRNEKIILRHITATALAYFFRENRDRFHDVEQMVFDWEEPKAVTDFKDFCKDHKELNNTLCSIVPEDMYKKTGLSNDTWIEEIAGQESRFAYAVKDACADYCNMERLEKQAAEEREYKRAERCRARMNTIAKETTLNFLSRYAVIPKYGFPVDVVELDTRSNSGANKVSLQRDLSQAIAEFAPGGKVVANKKEWESCGVKKIPDRELQVRCYTRDEDYNFEEWNEDEEAAPRKARRYLWPQFGFVTKLFDKPKEPQGRARRLYTTRPFFKDFTDSEAGGETYSFFGVKITPALPGEMVVLCEGKNGAGFCICLTCGASFMKKELSHKTPNGGECDGPLQERISLGHKFVTDVVKLEFPELDNEWKAYSLAYAILLGAAEALEVPAVDLNVTITGRGRQGSGFAIVLYDNVPGGAGLVANLEEEKKFREILLEAKKRVEGKCGCTESCYGCLRSYRNQFAHPHLRRTDALRFLNAALNSKN